MLARARFLPERPGCSANRPIVKLTNGLQIGFSGELPEKGKMRIAAYLLELVVGAPGFELGTSCVTGRRPN